MDVALVSDEWVGAHAVWDAERLIEALVADGDPTVPGLAGVAGMAGPADAAPRPCTCASAARGAGCWPRSARVA